MRIEAVVLEGRRVRLEPLAERHLDALVSAARHDALWRYMPFRLDDEASARDWIARAGAGVVAQDSLVFATVDRDSGELVGSTGFLAASPPNRRVEIGATWVVPARQRTPVNGEAKYLMLRHAFEGWGCNRVEFKTDSRNQRSREALLRIGAREEGTLRAHMVMPDGHLRDSVYFSVLAPEWPGVKQRLEARLA